MEETNTLTPSVATASSSDSGGTRKSNTWFRKLGRWIDKTWNQIVGRATGETQRNEALADRAHDETYNSPAAQLMRQKLAGVAPTGVSPVETDSSGMANETADGALSALGNVANLGTNMVTNGIGHAIDFLKLRKQKAEIAKLYSDIGVNDKNNKLKDLDITYREQVMQDEVKIKHYQALTEEQGYKNLVAKLDNLNADTAIKGKQLESLELANSLAKATYRSNIRLAAASADNAELDTKIKDYDLNKVMPKRLQEIESLITHYQNQDAIGFGALAVSRSNAHANSLNAKANWKRVQNDAAHVASMIGYYDEQTRSLKLENDADQATYDEYVESLKNTYKLTDVEARWAATHQWLKVVNSAAVAVGQGAAAYSAIKRGRASGARTGRMTSFDTNGDWEVGSAILM